MMIDIGSSDLRVALLCGLISAGVAVPVAYAVLGAYVAMTVSVMEAPGLFETMFRGGVYVAAFTSLWAGAFSGLIARRMD